MGREIQDDHAGHGGPRRPAMSLPRVFLASLVATCALVLYLLWNSYADARRATEATAQNIATAVARELVASRQHTGEGLRAIARSTTLVDALAGSTESLPRLQAMLDIFLKQHPDIEQLTVYDAAGRPLAVDGQPLSAMPVGGEGWFRQLAEAIEPGFTVSVIDPTAATPPALLIVERIVDGGGRFIGAIAVSRDIAAMTESFAGLDVGPRGAIVLRRIDNNGLLLRRPPMAESRPPVTPVWHRIQAAEQAGIDHYEAPDGIWRVYAFRTVDGLPLYINAGLADDDYLSAWRWRAWWLTLAAIIVLGALWLSMSRRLTSESRLAESELLFRSLSESTPAMVWMSRLDGAAVFFNPAWLRFTGRSLGDELAIDWLGDVHPDDRVATRDAYARALRIGEPCVLEYRRRRQDGEWRWVLDTGQIRRGASGEALGFVGTQIDITERKQAETEMTEKLKLQQQLTTLAATVPGVIYTFRRQPDGEGCFTYVSPAMVSALNLDGEDQRADTARLMALIHPEDRARVDESMRAAAQRRDSWQQQFRVVHPQRGTIWVDAHSVAVTERDGSVSWHGFMHDITARQRAEEALRASESRFRSYIESAPISILIIGGDGLIRECNSMVGEILGYPQAALRAKPFIELIEADDRGLVNRAFTQLIADGYAMAEFRVRKRGGGFLWASARGSRLPDGDFLVYVLDITDRREAEAALQRSEETMRMAMTAAPMGTWEWDPRTGEILWSPTKWAIFGRSPEEGPVTAELFRSVVHPDDLDRVTGALDDAWRHGNRFEMESRALRPDGSIRWLVSHGLVLRDGSGEPQRMVGIAIDITERKQAEQALIESRQRYKILVEGSPDAIYVCRDGILNFVNPAAVALFGATSASDLIGRAALDFFAEEEHSLIRERREQIARGCPVPTIEHEIIRLDGERRKVEVVVVPTVDGEGLRNELQVILRDVTERRSAERQLAQVQRMEAIGQLTGGLAHDFNNILGIILGSLDLLSAENLDADASGLVASAQAAANRGAEVTRSLLAVVRQTPLSSRVVDVKVLIGDMLALIQQTAGRRVETTLDLAAPRTRVSMDPGSFDTALLNLVINARDAMPGGGRLTIRTRNRHVDAINGVARLPDGDYLEIVVADTGVGMSPEVLARAFDPFFSTKERGKGTGLGLAMVYGFARQCGGTAFIDSSPGKGTRLHLMLPVATTPPDDPAHQNSEGLPRAHAGEQVLLVDDEVDLRAICHQWLTSLGYMVTEADSPAQALSRLDAQRFDALLSDVVMPGPMDGAALASAARGRQPHLAVLLISGYADDSIAQASARWRLLEKPFRREQLAREMRAAIDDMASEPVPD